VPTAEPVEAVGEVGEVTAVAAGTAADEESSVEVMSFDVAAAVECA
jgi:hypothetical protein